MIQHNNKTYKEIQAGPWSGLALAEKIETVKELPPHRWSGHKIPLAKAQQVLAFFAWSQEHTKSETVVHFMWHENLGWEVIVLPQRGYTGMTVELLPDHPDRNAVFQRLGAPDGIPYVQMGSWHHHCAASAFASSTDTNDEATKEGIHLTTGGLGSEHYSVHARASFRGILSDVDLSDWFECSEEVAPHLRHQQIAWLLCRPCPTVEFPDWWKANVHRIERPGALPNYVAGQFNHGVNRHGSQSVMEEFWKRYKMQGTDETETVQHSGNWVKDPVTGQWSEQNAAPAASSSENFTLNESLYDWLAWEHPTAHIGLFYEILEQLTPTEEAVVNALVELRLDPEEAVHQLLHDPKAVKELQDGGYIEAEEEEAVVAQTAHADAHDRDWPCHSCGTWPCQCGV